MRCAMRRLTTCRYSQRAKALLASYEIEPAPKVIELNVRSDGPLIQAILARLTGRKTVPNVLLKVRLPGIQPCLLLKLVRTPGQLNGWIGRPPPDARVAQTEDTA